MTSQDGALEKYSYRDYKNCLYFSKNNQREVVLENFSNIAETIILNSMLLI